MYATPRKKKIERERKKEEKLNLHEQQERGTTKKTCTQKLLEII